MLVTFVRALLFQHGYQGTQEPGELCIVPLTQSSRPFCLYLTDDHAHRVVDLPAAGGQSYQLGAAIARLGYPLHIT